MTAALAVLLAAAEPVEFQQAIDRALRQNPALRVAEADVDRAWALVEQQRAPSLPTLALNGTYTRLDADRVLADTMTGTRRLLQPADALQGNAQLAVPLIAPQRWANWWRASNNAKAQVATSEDVRRQVALNAARTWLSVLGQKRVLEAAVRARETAKAHVDYATQRRQGGVGNRLEEIRAQQELAVSSTQAENAAGTLVRLQEQLGVAVGGDVPLDAALTEPELPAPANLDEALKSTPERLDVKAATARRDAAEKSTHADFTDYLPLLTLLGQPFLTNPPSPTQPQTGWQASAVLSIPLYDGGLRYGQQKERRANAKQTDAQLENTLRVAKSEVRGAFEIVKHADEALKAARDAAKQAREALELSNLAYSAGSVTNLDVTDAERRARDAETAAAVAEDQSRQARLDLLAAAGRFP
ncbi:MAG: TolC family protein [Myxococcaceae bacterium]|nr:TolC family protein [Myxococcaceae bacterium]